MIINYEEIKGMVTEAKTKLDKKVRLFKSTLDMLETFEIKHNEETFSNGKHTILGYANDDINTFWETYEMLENIIVSIEDTCEEYVIQIGDEIANQLESSLQITLDGIEAILKSQTCAIASEINKDDIYDSIDSMFEKYKEAYSIYLKDDDSLIKIYTTYSNIM